MAKQFPNNHQPAKSVDCGPCSLLNVYEHFGLKEKLTTIKQRIHVHANGTYAAQLAQDAMEQGLEVELLTSSGYLVDASWSDLPNQAIIKKLRRWVVENPDERWYRSALYLQYYLEAGGKFKIIDFSTKLIDSYLVQGHVILALVEDSWLWGKRKIENSPVFDDILGAPRGHFVVVYGQVADEYKISDPYPTGLPNRTGLYSVNKDKVLVSMLLWGQQIIAIKK